MDLLPKVTAVDSQASERRSGTGAFARKRRDGNRDQTPAHDEEPEAAAEAPLDPLLAELDRMRAIDPALTGSGAHRALMALRAYHSPSIELEQLLAPAPPPPVTDAAALPEPGP